MHPPDVHPPAIPDLGRILYLSRSDVESLKLSWPEIRDLVHRVFEEKGHGHTESPPKRGIAPHDGCTIRAMNAFIPSLGAAGCKWIGGFPTNVARGLPTITGLMILNDLATGIPRAIMDCTWTTAARTAACTLVAASYLARADSTSVGVVACGTQGRVNLEALCSAFAIRRVRAYDVNPDAARRYAETMSAELNVEVETVGSAVEAVEGMDIVVTSMPGVKDPDPPIPAGALARGAFACLLDFDSAFQGDALREADKFVADDANQLAFFKRIGYFRDTPEPDADLGKIAAGRLRGREGDDHRTISMNLGIGLLDVAMAWLAYERARERGVGTYLHL